MRTVSHSPFRFFGAAMLFWCPVLLCLGVLEWTLWRGGELRPLDSVSADQRQDPSVRFMRGFMDQELQRYKLGMLVRARPALAVLGSSRTLELSERFVAPSFYNAGGILQGAGDLLVLADRLERANAIPKDVLVALDPWWFNAAYRPASSLADLDRTPEAARNWKAHWRGMRVLGLSFVRRPGATWRRVSQQPSQAQIGYLARRSGFLGDGSRHAEATRRGPFVDTESPPIAARIANGTNNFPFPVGDSESLTAAFFAGVEKLRALGATVTLYMPPMCSQAVLLLEQHPRWRGWWNAVSERLRAEARTRGLRLMWWPTPSWLGLTDDALGDCVHSTPALGREMMRRLGVAP